MPLDLSRQTPPENPESIAMSLKNQARNIYNNMVGVFNRGSKMFWDNPNATPQQIATALGTDAKELFELHYKLGQLISTINASDVMSGASIVGNFVYEEDGRVTIVPTNTPPANDPPAND